MREDLELALNKIVERQLYNYYALRYLFELNREYKGSLSIFKRLGCWFSGFSNEKYELYNFKENPRKLYLTDFQRRKTAMINGPYSIVLDDKNLFTKVLEQEKLTAQTYGNIKYGKISLGEEEIDLPSFIAFIKEKGKVIVKSYYGGGGQSVYRLSVKDDQLRLNDKLITDQELAAFIAGAKRFIISEHLTQADYAAHIFPETINTIRILTMQDPTTHEVFIPIAVHKFGSTKTLPADNVRNGGMTARVDIETGILQRSALHADNNMKIQWQELHPDTKVKIEGTLIPNWRQVRERIIQLAQSLDYIRYVGWDVVVTNDGLRIIEGNNFSDVNILQIHQPLLQDQRARNFYKHYGIIKR